MRLTGKSEENHEYGISHVLASLLKFNPPTMPINQFNAVHSIFHGSLPILSSQDKTIRTCTCVDADRCSLSHPNRWLTRPNTHKLVQSPVETESPTRSKAAFERPNGSYQTFGVSPPFPMRKLTRSRPLLDESANAGGMFFYTKVIPLR